MIDLPILRCYPHHNPLPKYCQSDLVGNPTPLKSLKKSGMRKQKWVVVSLNRGALRLTHHTPYARYHRSFTIHHPPSK